jgi:folate-dependent phosphoribosylglycinamide formyltransferase PurN
MDVTASNRTSSFGIAVLISGGGTTLRNFIEKIPAVVVERQGYESADAFSAVIFEHCRQANVELVVLGGFLKQISIPDDFVNRVVNIHPALIPAFCGKGYYGHYVHEAVLEFGVKVSGCTVHFVDNEYDHGPIIYQAAVPVQDDDTPDSLAARVFEAECDAYPHVLQLIADGRVRLEGRRVRVAPA